MTAAMPIPWIPDAVPHLVLLLAALAIEAAVGGRPGPFAILPHPVRLIGALIDRLERRFNDPARSGARGGGGVG